MSSRKFIIPIILFVASSMVQSATQPELDVVADVPIKEIRLQPGGPAGKIGFKLHNNSATPIAVTVDHKSCGCMSIELPENAIPPHGVYDGSIVIAPGMQGGEREESIVVLATAISSHQEKKSLDLNIHIILPEIAIAQPLHLRWKAGEGGEKIVSVHTTDPSYKIIQCGTQGEGFTFSKAKSSLLPNNAIISVHRDPTVVTSGGMLIIEIQVAVGKIGKFFVPLDAADAQDSAEEPPAKP